MPRRQGNVYCTHCRRYHPQYYGAALNSHLRAHRDRHERTPPARNPVQRTKKVIKVRELTAGNVGQKLADILGEEGYVNLLVLTSTLPQRDPGQPGTNSLVVTARDILRATIAPRFEEWELHNAGTPEGPHWVGPRACRYPIHQSLADSSVGLALLQDDVGVVKVLVALGMDPNSMLECGYRTPGVALLASANTIIRYLLSLGDRFDFDKRLNACGEQEETLMTIAYRIGRMDVVEQVLAANGGAIPGRTIFSICAFEEFATIGEVLRLGGNFERDIAMPHQDTQDTPLHAAVLNPMASVLDAILERVKDACETTDAYRGFLHARNSEGQTPLMYAIVHRRLWSFTTLVHDPDVNLNLRANGGQTALWYAAYMMDRDMVLTLINDRCDAGNPRGDYAATKGTPLNALLYAYEDLFYGYPSDPRWGELEVQERFNDQKENILSIARILRAHGCRSDLADDRFKDTPETEHPIGFAEWARLFR
ncbi:hypothetical protein ETB97_010868 [Aspergillus alliaceus]|uniref:Ankyrin repeat-containing domain protein n=1 Tax=Petromyces alliaceus TaxID=209559 RepID=A0A5N6FZT7_PETAA|nr:ankyrin repeat-containing domain protein [Aspergillus alliaceus]KAB8234430.1 ankyrin repeat-containing domain protein [Aspergillus alliaceus]KAE8385379.1 ankyrin repeat-containing domain protein [Aspergillus alliaceus]KAF5854904.1 hypothetical protein ETB97_010868 [Aspergillus burnettii]